MAAILEIDYFNSFWTKRIHTGAPCVYDTTDLSGVPGPTMSQTTGTFPGPVSFGDAVTGLQNQNIIGKSCTVPPCLVIPFEEAQWPGWFNSAEKQALREGYFIEDSRIRGGFGNTQVDLGVRAYLNEDNPVAQHRFASLIYSGPYNSVTGFNETNVFSIGESITKSVDPAFRSIQKLYADDTNLLILQENKSSYALIDKDAIYSAEGGGTVTSSQLVIGQVVPYLGEYGISQNPESFATFGFQKYFADKDRSAIMRLSRDGLTEISQYGMVDYFRDELAEIDNSFKFYYTTATIVTVGAGISVFEVSNPDHTLEFGSEIFTTLDGINYIPTEAYVTNIVLVGANQYEITTSRAIDTSTWTDLRFGSYKRGRILGGYDIYSKHYVASLQTVPAFYSTLPNTFDTLSFDEQINGWVSRYSYKPTTIGSLENTYYTTDTYKLYKQFDDTVPNRRGFFYENPYAPSSVTFFANGEPTTSKVFQTISYEGSNGWEVTSFDGDLEGEDFRGLNGAIEEYEQYQDKTTVVYSYLEGRYETNVPTLTGISAVTPPYSYAGFNRKENRYVANLLQQITNSSTYPPRPGEVVFGNTMSGIKGFYATITMSTDDVTEVGGEKELFSVASKVVKSS